MYLKHVSFEQHRAPNVQHRLQTRIRIVRQVIYMWVTERRFVSNKEEGNRNRRNYVKIDKLFVQGSLSDHNCQSLCHFRLSTLYGREGR